MAVKPIIQYTGKLYVEILYECDIDIEHDITVILYKKIKNVVYSYWVTIHITPQRTLQR